MDRQWPMIPTISSSLEPMMRIFCAFQRLRTIKGGFVVINDEKVVTELPLPIGGLLSTKTFEETAADLKQLKQQVKTLGEIIRHPL